MVFRVYCVSEKAQVELKSGRVQAPADITMPISSSSTAWRAADSALASA